MPQRSKLTRSKPQNGKALALELLNKSGKTAASYTASITSSDEDWAPLAAIARDLPVPERTAFLDTIYQNLRAEYSRQFQAALDLAQQEGRSYPSDATFTLSNREAQRLMIRIMVVLNVLKPCGEVPNYTYPELLTKLAALRVEECQRFAQAIHRYFPSYSPDQWIDVYGSEEAARASKFNQWSGFHWDQLRDHIHGLQLSYNSRLQEELGLTRKAPAANRIQVSSSDTDVVRVIEAMKRAKIIHPDTKGPQIVQAFEWQGKLNDKPRNYASFVRQLESPPSSAVIEMIKALLESAGDDVKAEIARLCRIK